MTSIPKTDFLAVSLAALARGFVTTPLKGKHPFTHEWNRLWANRTEYDIRMAAKAYPNNEVGVVLHRETGAPFAIDIDKPGVLERMTTETGKTLPETYAVLTRPGTASHKRHIFLRHTQYSYNRFDKNVFAGEYDLIGVGRRGLQVVAEGCVREDTGEVRVGNGKDIADCPDWFCDWVIEDVKQLRIAKARRERNEGVAGVTSMEVIPRGRRTWFLKGLAKWLVKFRIPRKDVFNELLRQCREYCEDGVKYADEGKQNIHAIAYDSTLTPSDPLRWCPQPKAVGLVVPVRKTENARDLRLLAISGFPDSITSSEVYDRLSLKKDKSGQHRVSRDMRSGGFEYDARRMFGKEYDLTYRIGSS